MSIDYTKLLPSKVKQALQRYVAASIIQNSIGELNVDEHENVNVEYNNAQHQLVKAILNV